MTTRKKKPNSKKVKVLHITDFELIFEPNDAKRKKQRGPLSFTKSLVTTHFLSKEAEIRYFERVTVIKAHGQRHLLRSVFEDLKNFTAAKYLGPRGYLVNADYKPASYAYLSDQLDHVPVGDLKKALKILERIGLLERIEFDGFPETNGQGRTQLDGSGRKRKPLNKGKSKSKGKVKSKKTIDNGNMKQKKNNSRQRKRHRGKVESKPQGAPPSTAQPPSNKSRNPAAGRNVIKFPASQQAVRDNRSPEKLGDIARDLKHRYDLESQDFAREIYEALCLTFSPLSIRGRREIGCFGSLWERAKISGIPSSALEELRVRAIQEAGKLVRRKSRCANISAVFCHIFNRLLAARGMAARKELGGYG